MDPIHVKFYYKEDPLSIHYTSITSNKFLWTWHTTLKDFEVIHGLSRLIRLIPDKLITAEEISRTSHNSDDIQSSFLIDLVIDLLKYYMECHEDTHKEPHPERDHCTTVHTFMTENSTLYEENENFSQSELQHTDITITMQTLLVCLSSLSQTLVNKNHDLYKQQYTALSKLLDLLQTYLTIYLDFIHPSWIALQRFGINLELLNTAASRVQQKLHQQQKHIDIFEALIYKYTLEP